MKLVLNMIYLTARNEKLGLEAVQRLERESNLKARFHQLAIDDPQSVDRFATYLKENHNGLDILINNAAIALFTGVKEDNETLDYVNLMNKLICFNFRLCKKNKAKFQNKSRSVNRWALKLKFSKFIIHKVVLYALSLLIWYN
jgi:NAD(P)-dependent dehydrogenase (short-subunit alcohol dehydrogenase family)